MVMMHWGNEYDVKVDDEQRRWVRWLVARGATTIVGSGPHVSQRDEIHGGASVLFSLGNAVYPRMLKGADSGEVREVEISCPPKGGDGNHGTHGIHGFEEKRHHESDGSDEWKNKWMRGSNRNDEEGGSAGRGEN